MPVADMARESTLGLWLSILLLRAGPAEAAAAKGLNGVLGESVTFQLKTPPPFQTISWSKSVGGQPSIIAVLTFQEPCVALTPLPAFRNRVKVSEDCSELHLGHLEPEDAARYAAQIVLPTNATEVESFELLVSINVTCRAENPVSNASTTVSLKEVCSERRPVTEVPPQDNENTPATKGWIPALIVALLLITVAVVVIYVLKKKAAERRELNFAQGSGTEDRAKNDSTLIGDGPKGARGKKDRPPRKAPKSHQEMPQTIYTAVQHPKQSPLQTDDEKMRKRQHGLHSQEEKTVYSEVSKSQESEDQNAKTIYETVKNPSSDRPSDFRALV
ncbi:uncharacterized protein LOC112541926 [Python bivittatus]|uniref:Uncharacterized protein LOC112541926 n=1 Tax=Python bivittatus TaxID=176946 RepID=A0A9F5J7S0_PYTBI|nr:uncharacterized protein LOC112541926 [Python bivittatus]